MKSLKVLLAMICLLTVWTTGAFAQAAKIGYVDLSRLFDEYYKTKEYDKVLEAQHQKFEEERNTKIEAIREKQGKLGLLQDDERAKVEQEVEELKAQLLEYDGQKKQDLTKDRNDKIREILLEIEKVVSDYAKANNYSVILNDRVLIYGDQSFDMTEPILEELNSGAPASQ